MKREIKFRAWNGKKMFHHDWRDKEDQVHDLWQFVVALPNDCILMQFTGLKDKNVKDIYEGDIVKAVKVGGIKQSIRTVEYRNHGFWLNDEEFGWEGEELYHWSMLEVIGNIYENPELLEH